MTAVLDRAVPVSAYEARRLRRWYVGCTLTLGLGAVTGFAYLGRPSFFLDETVSVSMASAPWRQFTDVVTHREANMVLYSVLLRGWIALGHGETIVRSFSVLAWLGAVAAMLALGRSLFGPGVALVAGLLLVVNPLGVEFAQDARGYALSLALVAASSLLFVRAVRGGGWGTWLAVAATAALAAYANFWAALVVLAQAVSLAFLPPGTVPRRRAAVAGGLTLVLLVPMGLLVHSTDSAGTNWAAGTAAGALFTKVRTSVPHVLIDVAVVAVVALAAGLVRSWRLRHRADVLARQWPVAFLLCWLTVPLFTVLLVSVAYKPLLVLRYLGVCLLPAIVLVAVLVCRLRGRSYRLTLIGLVLVSVVGVAAWYRQGPGQDWRAATAYVAANDAPGDGVLLFAPYVRVPFEWYLAQHPIAERRLHPVYPTAAWGVDPLRFDTDYFPVTQTVVARSAAAYHRVWLVLSQASLYPSQQDALFAGLRQAHLTPTGHRDFPGVEVVGYSATSGDRS